MDRWIAQIVATHSGNHLTHRLFANSRAKINWVRLLYDDAEVAENQQNTRIDGVWLTAKRPGYQNIPGLSVHERPNELRGEGIRAENRFILQCP
jgi:hypothetical protein